MCENCVVKSPLFATRGDARRDEDAGAGSTLVGARPDVTVRYPVSEPAAKYGASVAKETSDPNEAYADRPGEYVPVRLPWPLDSERREAR